MLLCELHPDILLFLWPCERVHLGLATNRKLREVLVHAPKATLKTKRNIVQADAGWGLEKFRGNLSLSARGTDCPQAIVREVQSALKKGWRGMATFDFELVCTSVTNFNQEVSDLGVTLQACRDVEHLDLHGSHIGFDGVSSIAVALPRWRTLKFLDLGYNNMGDQGAGVLATVLPFLSSVQTLCLPSNGITKAGAMLLACAIPRLESLESLSLKGNTIDEAAAHVCQAGSASLTLNTTEVLKANTTEVLKADWHAEPPYSTSGTDAVRFLIPVRHLPLRSLDLSENEIGSEGAYSLSPSLLLLSNLTDFNISCNGIGDNAGSLTSECPACSPCAVLY